MSEQSPKPTNIQIVPATEADLPGIAELAGKIWRQHYPGIITNEQIEYMLARMYALETLKDEITKRSIRFERLIVDGKMVGFASYGPTDQATLYKLHKLYVLPECHGKGLGSKLLQHCEKAVAALGAMRLLLTVNKRNEQAIRAYRRNGFVVTISVVADIGNGFVMDDFVMTKKLSARAEGR